jgi:hypothetical protein
MSIYFEQHGRFVTFAIIKLILINTKKKDRFKKVRVIVITGEEFVRRV